MHSILGNDFKELVVFIELTRKNKLNENEKKKSLVNLDNVSTIDSCQDGKGVDIYYNYLFSESEIYESFQESYEEVKRIVSNIQVRR